MSLIHPTAIIDPGAHLDSSVSVGPYAIIGAQVTIGANTTIGAHTVIVGPTDIGQDNKIYNHASLGADPQDKKYAGEPTRLKIGDRNVVREFVTLNRGTTQDQGLTSIGNDNWIMAYVHVAHDCMVGNNTIFANNASLAGHAHVDDYAILGGFTGVHQFVKIGAHVMTGIATVLRQDVPPFITVAGSDAKPFGINVEGLKRRGFTPEQIASLRKAFRIIYKDGLTLADAKAKLLEQITQEPGSAVHLTNMLQFLDRATRGILR